MKEKYSIWGMLNKASHLATSGVIKSLSIDHGGPSFLPHITILGDVIKSHHEMIDSTLVISQKNQPIKTELTHVDWSLEYFKALFINVVANSQLTKLRRESEMIVSISETLFFPHISLMYGNYGESLLKELKNKHDNDLPSQSLIKSVALVPITPNPNDWEIVKEFDLLSQSEFF